MAEARTIEVLYFARLRDKIGHERESVSVSENILTVADLLELLAGKSALHADALQGDVSVRAAVNQQHAEMDTLLGAANEVAFFPPMTGG